MKWLGKDRNLTVAQVFFIIGIIAVYLSWGNDYYFLAPIYVIFNGPIGGILVYSCVKVLDNKNRQQSQLWIARLGILIGMMVLMPKGLFIGILKVAAKL